ncbi:HD domain-containing protein [Caproicibacterium sp. BJN0003]|uniref:HD domain-containing protein n=1 Tax=Caproicibacterium sp. BJN0003 TaxID=2994078 RepID=UPI002258111E|nr:HD domain-containing protein [Caproicibacterium sp. BJN0003]UZT81195.1 HD domain-containing protein [Caproicibacterium sp. BJN0003]
MEQERIKQQLYFLLETDKMKNILRRTVLTDQSRRETDAEHSWHLALMAMVLYEYACPHVDLDRAIKMCLIHDLIEIYAGDTFAYDVAGNQTKAVRESEAADKLYIQLPSDQGPQMRALWEEFDAMETPDAQYAAACDRLQPFLNNVATDGYTWKLGRVTRSQVYQRMDMVRIGMPPLWPFVVEKIENAVKNHELLPE